MKYAYTAVAAPPVITNSEFAKQYTLTVRDLPHDRKPRERLLAEGPAALSTPELLAILFVNGTAKEDVLEMTHRIVQEYGGKSLFVGADASELAKDLNIPLMKAMQLVACGELGRRFYRRSRDGAPVIRTAKDVFEYVSDMRDLSKEHLRGLYLNGRYEIVHDEIISIGTVDANIVHPREVFRPAFAYSAAGVIIVHNHPSGNAEPSDADRTVTRELAEAGELLHIEFVDHVIVTRDAFTSVPIS